MVRITEVAGHHYSNTKNAPEDQILNRRSVRFKEHSMIARTKVEEFKQRQEARKKRIFISGSHSIEDKFKESNVGAELDNTQTKRDLIKKVMGQEDPNGNQRLHATGNLQHEEIQEKCDTQNIKDPSTTSLTNQLSDNKLVLEGNQRGQRKENQISANRRNGEQDLNKAHPQVKANEFLPLVTRERRERLMPADDNMAALASLIVTSLEMSPDGTCIAI